MLSKFFKLDELGTTVKQEIIAGATTFVTMAYIIIVNPKILEAAGIPFGPSMVATIISAFFGTLAMGVYAKRPFAIAPYMGENAFIAFTVVKVLGYSWQTAIGAIFIGGVLFTILTVVKIRSWLANAIPDGLKIAFAVGIGFFLTFIGLNETGIVSIGVPGAPVHVGNFHEPAIQLAILSFLLIGFLMIKKVNGSILIGIISISLLGFILGVTPLPEQWISLPPDISPILFKLDIAGALTWGFFAVILTVFVMDFVDTMGTLIGVSFKAGLLDENGNLPEIEKPMLCDALATVVGALLGTTTTGTYIESAAGIQAGGKSGLTSVVTAILFLTALFFAPFFTAIPAYAYGSALIIVGLLMMSPIAKINFDDLKELIPVFVTITLMSFTYNLGIGMTAGFVVYPLTSLVSGKIKEVSAGMWVLFVFSILFYIFYPY
ncbi:MAG: guanine permease [Ignavibacteria bacterium RBG_13_36_8]|nr:MAG: guanine permease [Ignavibacteria bacterium RBG_13_36_8]